MDTNTAIRTFTEFFRDRGHELIVGSSLIPPDGDPVMFTTAGMHPLARYLEGEPHPAGLRLVGGQRCLRTTDLDEVGDNRHLTVFQMLGSWSLGDYGGPLSLRWGLELLCDGFGLRPDRLYATVFGGDEQVGPDTEALETWRELGLPVEQTTSDNWWSNGPTGPCGPDSEIFAWTGEGPPSGTPSTSDGWLELWNHVTLRYQRRGDGSLLPLPQPSVDTGMGLERLMMVSRGVRSVYETDIFLPWLFALHDLWQPETRSLRVITDHLRSAIVVTGDGVRPASTGRGYVLRRLLRLALTELWRGDGTRTMADLPDELIRDTLTRFGQLAPPARVRDVLLTEERKFSALLSRGRSLLQRLYPHGQLTEDDYAYLHATHGLPRDVVTELAGQIQAARR
ncbi:MAG TPA: alanine--tRNA ligase-related protein [Streptosporangiaceae bacterium]|jgi:alanyl-tRNA synthetase|nr:alanine--tRNA ligase-related protein [Streptosporangiaceae bacterium]